MGGGGRGGFGSLVKAGFALTLGSVLLFFILTALALALFIPGFLMVTRENRKPKEQQDESRKVIGYILMALGIILGLGLGAGTFFSLIAGE